ncbi:MAG: glycosyltransferase, partial [Candidatus Omnitrophica bacterium]|nr:glycosyltransferase [Candidatus Omnitrophota bacterium]MBD3269110.1 glycosyltransferase [Candidatus Omnitrophota bacterium]
AIVQIVERCKKILADYRGSEIIVVDDASGDKTYEAAKSTGVKVLRHPHNTGYGRSLKDGISAAKNDLIAITDADDSYPVEEIPVMFKIYREEGVDMVVGARRGKYYKESFKKEILRKILKFLVEFTAGKKIDDVNSGLRVFSKKTISSYFDRLCDTFSFSTSLTLAYMMTDKYVKYHPVEYEKRTGETKVKIFSDSLKTLQFITEAIMRYNPIKMYILFSSALVIISLLNLIIAFFTKMQIAYTLGIAAILLAVVNLSIGLISIQLKQILNSEKE